MLSLYRPSTDGLIHLTFLRVLSQTCSGMYRNTQKFVIIIYTAGMYMLHDRREWFIGYTRVASLRRARGRSPSGLGPRPSRDSRTKETLVDFLGTPARFGMVQSDCRISLVTQLSRSNSRVTATQTPPPGHYTMRSSRITRLLLKCACA